MCKCPRYPCCPCAETFLAPGARLMGWVAPWLCWDGDWQLRSTKTPLRGGRNGRRLDYVRGRSGRIDWTGALALRQRSLEVASLYL